MAVDQPGTTPGDSTEAATQGTQSADRPAADREAVLFVPGTSRQVTDQSVEGVALRLAAAMDRNAVTARARFKVSEVRERQFGLEKPVRSVTILREDDGAEEPVADVYEVAYGDLFLGQYENAVPMLAILRVVGAIVPASLRLAASVRNRIMGWKEKLQIALAFLMLVLLGVYLVVLAGALVVTVIELWPGAEAQQAPAAVNAAEGYFQAKAGKIATFVALCCEGMARVDGFLTANDTFVVNEINTIPGFTRISMYPKLFEHSGIPQRELTDRLITLAIERHEAEARLRLTPGT